MNVLKTSRDNCYPEVLCNKDVIKNFIKFTGKYLCQSLPKTLTDISFFL